LNKLFAGIVPLLLGWSAALSADAGNLRAGAAVENITAEHTGTVFVHDPLKAKALVVDDGRTKVVLVCLDLGGVSASLLSGIRGGVREELAIDDHHVLINASHNHHTHGQVADDVVKRCVQAVRRAAESTVPVKIGAGVGHEKRIMMNRRLRLKDGKAWTIRRANPSPRDSDVVELGPVDTEIGILRLDKAEGGPLAVVYNFAGHAYGGVPDGGATADFPGFASAVLEEGLGDGAVALFLQGAAGDITPIRYKDVNAPPPTEQLGTMLGLSALKAVRQISTHQEATIRVVSETIELPKRKDVQTRIESLEAQQEAILQFFTGIGCGTHGAGTFLDFKTFLPLYLKHVTDPDHPSYCSYLYQHEEGIGQEALKQLDKENRHRVEKYLECIYQMERLIRIRSNLQSLKRRLGSKSDEPIAVEIQGVKIGDFVLVTFPGEPFAEVGLRIKKQSPFEYTFVSGYTNGHLGYAPTADAYRDEAYEDSLTPFAPQWQEIYEKKALDILFRLAEPDSAVTPTQ
jgi:hypothetical protein